MPKTDVLTAARSEFDELVQHIRPKLHRYCARMTGSVVEAEDIVQESLAKAYYLLSTTPVGNLEGWLFRIVHNKAIDYLRQTSSHPLEYVDEFPPTADVVGPSEVEEMTTFALSVYLQLTPMQRSCVIFKDVIGYSLAEISELLDVSVGAVKAALHRGRENLRALSAEARDADLTPLAVPETSLLAEYVERFNARDFDSIRAMLAEDVRLDLVERIRRHGASNVARYFSNYEGLDDCRFTLGLVERKLAVLVSELNDPSEFSYIILIDWHGDRISRIRDYRYARWVMQDAQIEMPMDG